MGDVGYGALSMIWALQVVGGVGDPVGNACALAGSDVLRHLEPQVVAWTDVITQPWHPVRVSSATELAALDFPQPVQASVLADAHSADAGARQGAPHLARNAVPGNPASQTLRHAEKDRHANYHRIRNKGPAHPRTTKGKGR